MQHLTTFDYLLCLLLFILFAVFLGNVGRLIIHLLFNKD